MYLLIRLCGKGEGEEEHNKSLGQRSYRCQTEVRFGEAALTVYPPLKLLTGFNGVAERFIQAFWVFFKKLRNLIKAPRGVFLLTKILFTVSASHQNVKCVSLRSYNCVGYISFLLKRA